MFLLSVPAILTTFARLAARHAPRTCYAVGCERCVARRGSGRPARPGYDGGATLMGHSIRSFRPGDEAKVYEVCLRTGNAGADATLDYDDPELLGHVFAGPYVALASEFAFMLVDESDAVVGYALGTPDTAEFSRACEHAWWPGLRKRYPEQPRRASDAALVRAIHHPWSPPEEILVDFPAHLHIDLLPEAQGAGHGRALMQALLGALADAGAPGVHVGVAGANVRAVGFYERLGFTTWSQRPDGRVMVKRLTGRRRAPDAGGGGGSGVVAKVARFAM